MGTLRSVTLAFVAGFSTCAVVARLMLPTPVSATSVATFAAAPNLSSVVNEVGKAVVSLETFPRDAEPASTSWPLFFGAESDPASVASGVIVSRDGYVVTNNHVVAEAGRVRARLSDGREFTAKVVGRDPHTDLAVLKIPARDLIAATLGDSRSVQPGDSVVAIGNPLGFENSVSVGVVSAVRRGPFRVDGITLGDMIQTDASINQGNSGGGLFGVDGRLVGINTAIMTPRGGGGSIGIGFATPAHRMRPVVDSLIARGKVPRPWLGIRYRMPTVSLQTRPPRHGAGVLVEDVLPTGPAYVAGLRPADILRQIGDCRIRSAEDLYTFAGRYQPGQQVKAKVLRGGKEQVLMLTLQENGG